MSHDLQNLITSPQTPGQNNSARILFKVFLMPKCPAINDSWTNFRTFCLKLLGTTSWSEDLFSWVNCLYNKSLVLTILVSPLFKPRLLVTTPQSALHLICSNLGSDIWASWNTCLFSLRIWLGTLSFLYAFSSCLAWALVTTPTEKWDISGNLEPSMLPITKSYKVSSMHNASVWPLKNGQSTLMTAKGCLWVFSSIRVAVDSLSINWSGETKFFLTTALVQPVSLRTATFWPSMVPDAVGNWDFKK